MTDHIASADKKAPTIIDRICEALEARRIRGDKSQHSDAVIYNDLLDDCIEDIRHIAAAGATEGEIEGVANAIQRSAMEGGSDSPSDRGDAEYLAKAAINAMLGRSE